MLKPVLLQSTNETSNAAATASREVELFTEHLDRILLESGQPGTPVFHPNPPGTRRSTPEYREETLRRWKLPLQEPAWRRTWVLHDPSQEAVRGHLDLHGCRFPSGMHRTELGIGVELSFRGGGTGRRLMETGIEWARSQGLEWIDLKVFGHNTLAVELYRKLGFVETGFVRDVFRIGGDSMNEYAMSLRL